ncbi:prepilin-type N-terminal cleavage/methylation domain-containing protein [Candidatus Saccharibacteria bacterium]|nr:prepilin-type N-terminal cleavage/methylation domain-containing protein [Candidatus Saccharibacteria bacterium]
MTNRHLTDRGFTIVELLIVIVVIGILAAITIVAYNGIQSKALNATTLSSINAYKKAIQSYAVDKGIYPPNIPACLSGQASLGVSNDQCSTTSTGYKINSSFDTSIKPYLAALPKTDSRVVTGTIGVDSYQFNSSGTYGIFSGKPSLYYWLLDATTCPNDGSVVGPYVMQNSVSCIYVFPNI